MFETSHKIRRLGKTKSYSLVIELYKNLWLNNTADFNEIVGHIYGICLSKIVFSTRSDT